MITYCEHAGLRMAYGVIVTKSGRETCTACFIDDPNKSQYINATGPDAIRLFRSFKEVESDKTL